MDKTFDSSSFAAKNGNFIGLPYDMDSAKVVFLPIPWEATVSYRPGTAEGPQNILDASYQLDLLDWDVPDAWKTPMFWMNVPEKIKKLSDGTRNLAVTHIDCLENQKEVDHNIVSEVNKRSTQLNKIVYENCKTLLNNKKIVGLVGGDHSVPFGYLKALSEEYDVFGILQIDAHCDLRKAYEDFEYSHASIFYNVLEKNSAVQKLVQLGIRDTCEAEINYAEAQQGRVRIFSNSYLRRSVFEGKKNFKDLVKDIIDELPPKVYISFDIDGMDPKYCPNTGTPVPGGLEIEEIYYLLESIRKSGKQIIGFDLCEVGSSDEWDGNVGARILYKLALCAANCSGS